MILSGIVVVSLSAQLNQVKSRVADFLFPPHCIGCGLDGEFICFRCRSNLHRLLPPICSRCGKPLGQEDHCYSCQGLQLELDGIQSPFLFEGIIRNAIHKFKYNNYSTLAFTLALLLAEYWKPVFKEVDIIVPVPLHSRRLRARGYNQAALLAQELGGLINLPVENEILFRVQNSSAQVKASNAEIRRKNVMGAFDCHSRTLEGKNVLLIDDVCTTGATLNACATALKRNGIISVWGLTLAREI